MYDFQAISAGCHQIANEFKIQKIMFDGNMFGGHIFDIFDQKIILGSINQCDKKYCTPKVKCCYFQRPNQLYRLSDCNYYR